MVAIFTTDNCWYVLKFKMAIATLHIIYNLETQGCDQPMTKFANSLKYQDMINENLQAFYMHIIQSINHGSSVMKKTLNRLKMEYANNNTCFYI